MTTLTATAPLQQPRTAAPGWSTLYKAGGFAALLTAVFLPIQIAVIILYPMPETVMGWFALFQQHRLAALLDLDLLLVVDQVLAAVMFTALYAALRRTSPSWMAIATASALISVVLFIAANPAFAMLSLSDQYAAAATQAQKTALLGAGQAMLAAWEGSAFHASYILGSLSSVAISIVMLASGKFGRGAPWMGIVANAMALGYYVPQIGIFISIFSVLFLWVWYILTARVLLRGASAGLEA